MVIRKLLATVTCALLWILSGCSPPPPDGAESVIVVHGLGRTSASMTILVSRLKNAGFRVVNFGYPSTSEPMEALVDRLQAEVGRCCEGEAETVHFVTHSMGGVLVRSYLDRQPEAHQGRVVMLSPPNQGSEIIDVFADSPLLQRFVGPAGSSLGTDSAGMASQLGPVRFGLGIVTGDRSMNPLASWLIPGPDDGKVAVDRARVEGATDFIVVSATHTFIMNRRDVAEEVVHFIRNGQFEREDQ
ncbi:MAG: alpha/beta fold hydrolase [Gemmatimonadota bacterium]|nr:alpha/beta fold hydrolase [Gemmatimonadota bacterium]